jgi:polar amino acid transport system permease protein
MLGSVTISLLGGFATTIKLFLLTLLFALPLGLLISFGTMNRFALLRGLVKTIVWAIRGTPLMLQIIAIYYGPGILWGGSLLPRFTAALVAFSINYACYFSEIFRGGIQSIPRGQYEAGLVLGMTRPQIFFRVTLLQVIKRVIPPMGNEFITLVKDTALARTIAVYEVLWMGEKYIKSAGLIWPLFYTAVFYLAFNGILTLLFGWFEKKMDYFRV